MLEVYQRPCGDTEALVCLDETSKQQVKETRAPRPARPGAASGYDYEYERNGVSNLFMLFAPLEGWRRVGVTDRRTKVDWAHQVKKLVDEDYPDKDRIMLVMDNPVSSTGQALNTHHPASLYEAFEPMEARRIAERLEIHYTAKHGSWLNPVLSLPKGWLKLKSECWPGSAWTAGFPIKRLWAGKLTPGRTNATGTWREWTGASPPPMHALN